MPDLGKYAFEVLLAYGVTLALVGALVVLSIRRNTKVRAELNAIEAKKERS